MENEIITINAPMAPVIDVIMPPLREGGVSMVAPEYDNSMANYYKSLRETVRSTTAAFKSIIDTGNEKAKWDIKNKLTREKAIRSFMLNEATELGLIPESFKSPTAKQFVDAVTKNTAKDDNLVLRKAADNLVLKDKDDNLVLKKVEEGWDANGNGIPDYLERMPDADGNGIPDYLERSPMGPPAPAKVPTYVVRKRAASLADAMGPPALIGDLITPPANPWILQASPFREVGEYIRGAVH